MGCQEIRFQKTQSFSSLSLSLQPTRVRHRSERDGSGAAKGMKKLDGMKIQWPRIGPVPGQAHTNTELFSFLNEAYQRNHLQSRDNFRPKFSQFGLQEFQIKTQACSQAESEGQEFIAESSGSPGSKSEMRGSEVEAHRVGLNKWLSSMKCLRFLLQFNRSSIM